MFTLNNYSLCRLVYNVVWEVIMPNPEEMLKLAEKAIAQRNIGLALTFVLCDIAGDLACIPAKNNKATNVVFIRLSEHQLQFGLTSAMWNKLSIKLARFYAERNQCPKLHKQ